MEPFGRSASPSPTAELMRGAGTTPILCSAPEGAFGDAAPKEEEEELPPPSPLPPPPQQPQKDLVWGSASSAGAPSPPSDPFGAAFDPPPPAVPTAVVTPLSVQPQPTEAPPPQQQEEKIDLFGFDSDDPPQQPPLSAQPLAPPPSPFGGLADLGQVPDLRAQAIANAVGVALPMPQQQQQQQQSKPSSGLEDLDFCIQAAMQPKLSPVAASPTFGGGPRPPYVGQPFPGIQPTQPYGQGLVGAPQYTAVPGMPGAGTTTPGFGTPPAGMPGMGGAGTPGYGTPPSGMSSPAKSVTGFGAQMPGDILTKVYPDA